MKIPTKQVSKFKIFAGNFVCMFLIYILLMSLFTVFYMSGAKEEAITYRMGDFESTYEFAEVVYDEIENMEDNPEYFSEELSNFTTTTNPYYDASAIYDNRKNLLVDPRNKWLCSFMAEKSGDGFRNEKYAYIDYSKYFNEDDIRKINNYLDYDDREAGIGKICGYSAYITGLHVKGLEAVAEKIEIYPSIIISDGISAAQDVACDTFYADLNNTEIENMFYVDSGYIEYVRPGFYQGKEWDGLTINNDKYINMVCDVNNLEKVLDSPEGNYLEYRTGLFSYLIYSVNTIYDDVDSSYKDAYMFSVSGINLLEDYSRNLIIILLGCFAVFFIGALILSLQMYKTYMAQHQLEMTRRNMTNAVAHDLKTPLVTISGYADLMAEDMYPEKKDYYIAQIQQGVMRMDGMIKQMLELSRLESTDARLVKESVELVDLTNQILKRYELQIEEKQCEVKVELVRTQDESEVQSSTDKYNDESDEHIGADSNSVESSTMFGKQDADIADYNIDNKQGVLQFSILADRSMLEFAINNLISNAVNHVSEGGCIVVSIGDGRWSVHNIGEGISDEDMEHIWEAFYRGDKSRSNPKSTGLGLFIVKTVMELHGFKYWLENDVDGVVAGFECKI